MYVPLADKLKRSQKLISFGINYNPALRPPPPIMIDVVQFRFILFFFFLFHFKNMSWRKIDIDQYDEDAYTEDEILAEFETGLSTEQVNSATHTRNTDVRNLLSK